MKSPWRLVTRSVMSLILAWQFMVVVKKLRKRSSFVKIRRQASLTRVDLVLENENGEPTSNGVVSVRRSDHGIELHMRPGALEELAQIDRAFVPNGDPDASWPNFVQPPVAQADIVSAAETAPGLMPPPPFPFEEDEDDNPLAQAS
jgi:hypothetical protein